MDDWKAGFRAELRAIEIATADAASAQLSGLLRRLRGHQAGLAGSRLLSPYRRWRIHRLSRAIAEARWHVEQGRLAKLARDAERWDPKLRPRDTAKPRRS